MVPRRGDGTSGGEVDDCYQMLSIHRVQLVCRIMIIQCQNWTDFDVDDTGDSNQW